MKNKKLTQQEEKQIAEQLKDCFEVKIPKPNLKNLKRFDKLLEENKRKYEMKNKKKK